MWVLTESMLVNAPHDPWPRKAWLLATIIGINSIIIVLTRKPSLPRVCGCVWVSVPIMYVRLDILLVTPNPIWSERFIQPFSHWMNSHWKPTQGQTVSWALEYSSEQSTLKSRPLPSWSLSYSGTAEDTCETSALTAGSDSTICCEGRGMSVFSLAATQRLF